MTQKPGVYKISFGDNDRIYIGSAMNLGRRKSQHLYKLRRNNHDNPKLQSYYNKYGEELLSFSVLEITSNDYETVRNTEQLYINKYFAQEYISSGFADKRFDLLLLNVTPEVDVMRVHWTSERKQALVKRNQEHVWTDEQKKKIGKFNKERTRTTEEKRNKVLAETLYWENVRANNNRNCPVCSSNHIRKIGVRHNKTKNIQMQRCMCMDCNKRYSQPVNTGTLHSDM